MTPSQTGCIRNKEFKHILDCNTATMQQVIGFLAPSLRHPQIGGMRNVGMDMSHQGEWKQLVKRFTFAKAWQRKNLPLPPPW